jgi:hypothetical protein
MSETLSGIPAPVSGTIGALGDIVGVSQGGVLGVGGSTHKLTLGQILAASGALYAGDPAYGVVADGVTDDTNAWIAVLAAAATAGRYVVAPIGVSLFTTMNIPSNVGIIGRSTESYSGSSGSETLGSVLKATSGTLSGITMAAFSQLMHLQVSGNSSQPCIDASAGNALIFDVDMFGGSDGIRFNTLGAKSEVVLCRIHECTRGISNPVNVRVLGTTIASCGNGITMGNGCNFNKIVGNTIEKSTTNNILIDGTGGVATGTLISGNAIEAAGAANILLRAASYINVSSNLLGRAGRGQVGSPGASTDTTIYLQTCLGCNISGNTSWVGKDDGGTGYSGPFWAVYDDGSNTNCIIGLNVLPYHNNAGSSTSGPINSTSTFNLAASLNQAFWSA